MYLIQNLIKHIGRHYANVRGTQLPEEGKAGIKANAKPVVYSAAGLRVLDGSYVDVVVSTGTALAMPKRTPNCH
ncbi:hypothetical protein N7491_003483 [Penicillium cf. griseofulvum]|uniref:Uncharacterized protein n=1 Tax=Penicillium cf. griseofulvum TaxID=2972120 RepID=A0A9W9T1E1_9EURO|nr:hypothetical protein N7472_002341 [Penicillium cf. griseofulvum]KAJ5441077.1 hypothetical protein N7491_003483 [Penicillium cf. griseofulvum]KAJ5449124.1 hypothetical protein N7445_003945 [Penicillium cf. griseofulvum]